MRLDKYLVENNFVETRNKAQELIKQAKVKVNDKIITKPSFNIFGIHKIEILDTLYVSRSAWKLKNYINKYNISFNDKLVLDVGSSTGGFTQVVLESNPKKVICVDVGKNQLHSILRNNPKVEIYEQTDIRNFNYNQKFDIIVSDVSFISLLKIVDKLNTLSSEFILLFKPQFEVGKFVKRDKKGVVQDENAIINSMYNFENYVSSLNWRLIRKEKASIPGKKGNLEFIYHFKA